MVIVQHIFDRVSGRVTAKGKNVAAEVIDLINDLIFTF